MAETYPGQSEIVVTSALTEHILGRSLGLPLIPHQVHPVQDGYSERHAIANQVAQRTEQVFAASLTAAAELNIPVTPEMVDQWPDPATLNNLRESLVRQRKRIGMLDGFAEFVATLDEDEQRTGTKLRPNQLDSMHKVNHFMNYTPPASWQTTGKAGAIEAPTGGGKTGTASKIIAALKHGENPAEPVRVLYLTSSQTILKQTLGRDGKRGLGKFAPGLDVGEYWEERQEFRDVTVATTASFNNLMASGKLPDFDAVVVDECDIGYEGLTGDNLKKYCVDKILVGLTATPVQSAEKNIYSLYEHNIAKMDLRDAVRDGILAPVRARTILKEPDWSKIALPSDPAEQRQEKRKHRMRAWLDDVKHKIITETVPRGVGAVVRLPAGGDIEYARRFAEELRQEMALAPYKGKGPNNLGLTHVPRQIRAMEIGGSAQATVKGRGVKDAALSLFDKRELDVLTHVSALERGWDSDWPYDYYDVDPNRSRTKTTQALGRTLRMLTDKNGVPLAGPDGKPIRAEAMSYLDPDMEDQFTVCDALNLKSGEVLDHQPFEVRPRKGPKKRDEQEQQEEEGPNTGKEDSEFRIVITAAGEVAVVEVVELAHGDADAAPQTAEAQYSGEEEILDYQTALAHSGLGQTIFRRLWQLRNLEADGLILASELYADLRALWEVQPMLKPEPLPEEGFVHITEVMSQLNRSDLREFGVRQLAARHKLPARRFITSDDRVGFYFAVDDIPDIIAHLAKQ